MEFEPTCFTVEALVRGYHVYKDVWEAQLTEELPFQRESGNTYDPFAVAIKKATVTVGHVPRKISSAFSSSGRIDPLPRRVGVGASLKRTSRTARPQKNTGPRTQHKNFRGLNFRGSQSIREIRENLTPRKFPAIRYAGHLRSINTNFCQKDDGLLTKVLVQPSKGGSLGKSVRSVFSLRSKLLV